MMTFMARLLHTPPSRFSRPSTVPLEVAGVWGGGVKGRDRIQGDRQGEGGCDARLREEKQEKEGERR